VQVRPASSRCQPLALVALCLCALAGPGCAREATRPALIDSLPPTPGEQAYNPLAESEVILVHLDRTKEPPPLIHLGYVEIRARPIIDSSPREYAIEEAKTQARARGADIVVLVDRMGHGDDHHSAAGLNRFPGERFRFRLGRRRLQQVDDPDAALDTDPSTATDGDAVTATRDDTDADAPAPITGEALGAEDTVP
jgi:hypothetical protein